MKSQTPDQGFLAAEKEVVRSILHRQTAGGTRSFHLVSSMYIQREMPPDEYDT